MSDGEVASWKPAGTGVRIVRGSGSRFWFPAFPLSRFLAFRFSVIRVSRYPAAFIVDPELLVETEKLTRSWAQHEAGWLRNYLVSGVEDPRINLPSILSRHFLIEALLGKQLEALMLEEYRFAAVMDWLLRVAEPGDVESRAAIRHALRRRADNAEGIEIPGVVLEAFAALPAEASGCAVPNYLEAFLAQGTLSDNASASYNEVQDTFARAWACALATRFPVKSQDAAPNGFVATDSTAPHFSLFEPACGSANDYRFLDQYGIARLCSYTGLDLCQQNIQNAQALFPRVRFELGNVFEIPAPAEAFDFCLVQDLFEHLSISGLHQAVREVCRVTRRGICAGFFQMDEIPEHMVRPRDDYFWNLLSLGRMRELFASHGFRGRAIHIDTFLSHHTGRQTHNPNAYTLFLWQAGMK